MNYSNDVELKVCKGCDAPLPLFPKSLVISTIMIWYATIVSYTKEKCKIELRECFTCDKPFSELFRCRFDERGIGSFMKLFRASKTDDIFYQYGGIGRQKKR